MKALLLVLVLLAPAFADIRPGPQKPEIEMKLVKNGQPYKGEVKVTYLCSEQEGRGSDSPVAPYDVELSCSEGKCTNEEWYYKFNPCYYSKGSFLIETPDGPLTTKEMDFTKGQKYSLEIDVENNSVLEKNGVCAGFALLAALALFGSRLGF
ncbi:MAG: hypothetical protein QW035_01720 [Candidatus Anstonellales archaeon]